MHTSSISMVVQAVVLSVGAVVAAAWWFTVPGVMMPSTFVALCGVLAASGWVVKSTCLNAQPASSLAQSLHDVEASKVHLVRR